MTLQKDPKPVQRYISEAEDLLLEDPEKALKLAIEAIEYAQELDLNAELGKAYLVAGSAHQQMENTVEAIFMYKHGLVIAEEINHISLQVKLLFALANHYEFLNDLDSALQLNVRALELANHSQQPHLINRIKDSLVRLFSDLENHTKALELAKEVQQYWETTENYEMRSRSFNNMGIIYGRTGRTQEAIDCYQKAIELARKHQIRIGEAYVLNNLGSLYLQEKRFEEAIDFLKQSLRIKQELNKHYFEVGTILNLFEAYTYLEEIETAESYLNQAEQIAAGKKTDHARMKLSQKKVLFFKKKAELARREQNHEAAYEAYAKMIEEYELYEEEIIEMYSDKTSRRVAELEVQHEVMKRDQEARFHLEQNIELSRKNEEIQAQRQKLQEALESLSQREEQLTRANAAKDRFFSIIAHDLKTPLSGVINGVELLRYKSMHFEDPKLDRILKIVENSAGNLSALLQNLLEWAKTQRGEMKYQPKSFSTPDLISKITELYFYTAEAKNIMLDVENTTGRLAYADPDMVYTILRNLVSNALKFSHPNSKVTIRLEDDGHSYSIVVIDRGIGMSESLQASLFNIDRNSSRKGTNNESGTGLGLILSNELAQANRGRLTVKSAEGKGSIFTLRLPLPEND